MGDMTRLLLLLLLWVGASVSTPVDLEKRVIGGKECEAEDRQFHVKLIGFDGTHYYLCGGSLISKDWILTAAHCNEKTITAYVGIHPSGGGGGQATEAKHEIFIDKQSNKHDIMLLKLRNPVTTVKPVGLPNCMKNPAKFLGFLNRYGTKVQVAGHGSSILGPYGLRVTGPSPTLQCAELEIVRDPKNECYYKVIKEGEYGKSHYKFYKSDGKDTSGGDSGGGVVYKGMIYGVHTVTLNPTRGCVAAAGFVEICHRDYKKWIKETTGLKFPRI